MKTITCILLTTMLLLTLSAYNKSGINTQTFDTGIDTMFVTEESEDTSNKSFIERVEIKGYGMSPLKLYTGIDIQEYIELSHENTLKIQNIEKSFIES